MHEKVGAKTETKHRNIVSYDDISELVDLLRCEKLTFVNDYDFAVRISVGIELIYVTFRTNRECVGLKTYS